MSGVTGIELGPDSCVLVRGGRPGSHRTVSAASAIVPAGWPEDRHALVERLREFRQRDDLSSRARVVAWGPESALAPLTDAGFEIVSVLSPAQALARVVRARQVGAPEGTAIAALSLNSHGAAIAIVAGTEIIHSRVFDWPLGIPFRGARSELLDRYLLVTQIAPQLHHAIDFVRPVYGATVTSVVACGNLPNLRSLAMLLIEEMDLEVETLDSADLLEPGVAPGTLTDAVASLQLAAAVASSGENRVPVHADSEPLPEARPAAEEHGSKRVRPPALSVSKGPGTRLQSLAALAALVFCMAWSFTQVFGSSPAVPILHGGIEPIVAAAVAALPEPRAEATAGRTDVVPEPSPAPTSRRKRPRSPVFPLPSVDGIMISGAQRLAIVGGDVVAEGDSVGPRLVARIERDGVVLREASGREIFVAIRPQKSPDLRFMRD